MFKYIATYRYKENEFICHTLIGHYSYLTINVLRASNLLNMLTSCLKDGLKLLVIIIQR